MELFATDLDRLAFPLEKGGLRGCVAANVIWGEAPERVASPHYLV